jgi:outer membrane protein, heavy metal efflux system
MLSSTKTAVFWRLALLAAGLAAAPVWAQTNPAESGLKALFDRAWARQPEAQALQARREAVQAQRRAADAWTPEPAALQASHKTDRLMRNEGTRELEVGVAAPLWLPGQRRLTQALAEAEAAAVESRVEAARLHLAASVREAWWNAQRVAVDFEAARGQLDSARQIASDVARRARAGELARADEHQAEGAVATAEAALAQAQATASATRQQLKALGGEPAADVALALPVAEPEPALGDDPPHPALAEGQGRASLAERAAALAQAQSRANPELALSTTLDRGAAGQRYGQTLTLALRIPFGGGPRDESKQATARADLAQAQAQLALDRARVQADREAAVARVDAARAQRAAAERRATLARETRGFFEKSFRLGQTDLPMRLRIEAEATDAERQAARSRIEQAAAISAWRQALGLLPQ